MILLERPKCKGGSLSGQWIWSSVISENKWLGFGSNTPVLAHNSSDVVVQAGTTTPVHTTLLFFFPFISSKFFKYIKQKKSVFGCGLQRQIGSQNLELVGRKQRMFVSVFMMMLVKHL